MSDDHVGRPTLILVTGPGGSGKTTLAHRLAREVGCPVISRDELKEGMVATVPGFVASPSDPLTMRTYDLFFAVIQLLLDNGVTHVAEAAFQHHNWVRGLEPLLELADVRVIRCQLSAGLRRERAQQRGRAVHTRAAHDDAGYFATDAAFDAIRLPLPTLDVDTEEAYRPAFDAVVDHARGNDETAITRNAPPATGRVRSGDRR